MTYEPGEGADFADLHMHSGFSDGVWRPAKLVRAACHAGLGALAITDHDDVRSFAEAEEAGREHGVRVLSGVEISTRWNGADLHLLAYGFDGGSPGLQRVLGAARTDRRARAARMTERLVELGVGVTMASVEEIAGEAAIGRPHVARALLQAGHVRTIREAFDEYLGDGKPACVQKASVTPAEAVQHVHAAGGVVVVAHPVVTGGPSELEELLSAGVDGVEVRHSLHGKNSERAFHEFTRTHGLLRTGGSDFHGPGPGGLGVGTVAVPREWWDELLEGIRGRRREASIGTPASWENT